MQLTTLTKKSIKGFTLIELLVVIAIIGLLSTIVAAPVQSARKKAKDTKKVAEIKQLQTALANFANDNSQFPAGGLGSTTLTNLQPTYMPSIPSSLTNAAPRDHTIYVAYSSLPVGAQGSTSASFKTFAYHLGATLEVYNPVLSGDDDCTGVVSTTTTGTVFTGLQNGTACEQFTTVASTSLNVPVFVGNLTSPVSNNTTALNGVAGVLTGTGSFIFTTNNYVAHPFWPTAGNGTQGIAGVTAATTGTGGAVGDFQGYGAAENATTTCTSVDQCIYDISDVY